VSYYKSDCYSGFFLLKIVEFKSYCFVYCTHKLNLFHGQTSVEAIILVSNQ